VLIIVFSFSFGHYISCPATILNYDITSGDGDNTESSPEESDSSEEETPTKFQLVIKYSPRAIIFSSVIDYQRRFNNVKSVKKGKARRKQPDHLSTRMTISSQYSQMVATRKTQITNHGCQFKSK
jgi:hypothetical protein